MREGFGSKFGVLVALAGSAVGLGNFWRFPYLMGQNGGAAFIILYIAFACLLCLPIFIAEFIIGRRAQQNAHSAFIALHPSKAWGKAGILTILTPFVILCFYSVIGGWSVFYMLKSFTLSFTTTGSQTEIADIFTNFVSDPWTPIVSLLMFIVAVCYIVAKGVKGGIERYSKVMMPVMFVLVLLIAIYSCRLDGAQQGLSYMFRPDFSKLNADVCLKALGQAFFSLSLGSGVIMTYASYVSKGDSILKHSVYTVIADLLFAVIAGLAIMPAVFAFGLEPGSGPGLVFEALPYIFSQMPAGAIVAILFFIALLLAALSSAISQLEAVVAWLVEEKKMSRVRSSVLVSCAATIFAVLCSLSFGVLSDIRIFGMTIFDTFDYVSSNILLTVMSLIIVLFVGWKMSRQDVYDEFTNSGTLAQNVRIFRLIYFLVRYVAPVAVITVFLAGIIL